MDWQRLYLDAATFRLVVLGIGVLIVFQLWIISRRLVGIRRLLKNAILSYKPPVAR
ncbi:MAG TPA: hypothetical protein VJK50_01170 [Patescibacteria group bacterium]|nr:hypothetical protein [Patescibacteria group bacterium]